MKRRIFYVIMAFAMCCSFSACDKSRAEENTAVVSSNEITITQMETLPETEETTIPIITESEIIEIEREETIVQTEPEKPEWIYVTTNDNLNFRREESTSSDIICVIDSGTKVKLLDFNSDSDFYLCEFEGVKGYLFKDYVNVTKETLVAQMDTSIQVQEEGRDIKENEIIEIYKVNDSYITEEFEGISAIHFDDFISYSKYLETILQECDTELLTSFSTSFSSGNNRAYNIALAASEIDSVVIAKGENFNWHEVVGNTSKDDGYLLAGVYYNGESSEGYGGGVCQVSSTLYNCVLNMDMQVIERHKHSKPVSYVDYASGKDAAVGDIGAQNLIFKNNTDSDIVIKAYVNESSSEVVVEFYKIIV